MSAAQSVVPLIGTILLPALPQFLSLELITYILQAVWWPFLISWIGVSYLDNSLMREFLYISTLISFAGPFFLYFVGIVDLVIKAVDSYLLGNVGWWISIGVMTVFTFCSIVYQVILVPRVLFWILSATLPEDGMIDNQKLAV